MPEKDDEAFAVYYAAVERDIAERYARVHCRDCIHWLIGWHDEKRLIEGDEEEKVRGQCRRKAPTPFSFLAVRHAEMASDAAWAAEEFANIKHEDAGEYAIDGMDMFQVDEWPLTLPDAWCGDGRAGRMPPSAERLAELEALHAAWNAELDARRAEESEEQA